MRASLFDESAAANWASGWHQDRSIAVQAKAEVAGFGRWSKMAGIVHVEPPFPGIEQMTTIRVHLDDVDVDNAPRSHMPGRLQETEIEGAVARCEIATCLAARGDVWRYATAIVPGAAATVRPRRRCVLQVDFSNVDLPAPLAWFGI